MSPLIKPLDVVIRTTLHQARVMAKADRKRQPNWVLAMELFICGSTAAHEYCEAAGVDPDGFVFQLWPYKSRLPVRANPCCEIVLPVENGLAGPTDLAVAPVVGD